MTIELIYIYIYLVFPVTNPTRLSRMHSHIILFISERESGNRNGAGARVGLLTWTGEWTGGVSSVDIMGVTETVEGKEASEGSVAWGWDLTKHLSNISNLGLKLGVGVRNGVPGGRGVTTEWVGSSGAGVWNWEELTLGLGVKLSSASSKEQGRRGRFSLSAASTPHQSWPCRE